MKSYLFSLLTFLFICFSLCSFSQTDKGSLLLGGNAHFQFNDPFYINLNPNLGVFLLDRFVKGGSLPLYFSSERNSQSTSIGLNPFARYYFGQSKVHYFLLASGGYARTWYYYNDLFYQERISSINSTWNIGTGAGAVYFISQQIGLEMALVYRVTNAFSSINDSRNRVN